MLHLDAGRYAAFLWPAYGVTVVALGWLVFDSLNRSRRWRREVETREAARKQAREG
jgi:heme exporter protein D